MAGSQPSNACIKWLRGEPCKKVDATITYDCSRFDHLDKDHGKYPNASYPQAKAKKK